MCRRWKKEDQAHRRGPQARFNGDSKVAKPVWIVNRPSVVSEVIDGELVVMNLATGNYFSSTGTGAALWACLEAGMSEEALAATLVARHGIDAARAAVDVEAFLAWLRAEGLVRECAAGGAIAAAPAATAAGPYEAPQMHVYSDMRDLLMLDPIHDVAEEGWPSRPAEDIKQAS
jgi:hypothetical protein